MHRLCGQWVGEVGDDSLARHHLRLEDHHRVAFERRLRHGLGRRRLDDLRLARFQSRCLSSIADGLERAIGLATGRSRPSFARACLTRVWP